MTIINQWSKIISKSLNANYDISALNSHTGIIGEAREIFITNILEKFLPKNVIIGKGEIIDSQNNKSKQIDIIIYRGDFPIIDTGGTGKIYLIEGVLATIEVKSTLNEKTLFEALNNGKSVKNLQPSILKESLDNYSQIIYKKNIANLDTIEMNSLMGIILPSNYIFSYKGYTNSSIENLINSINKWYSNFSNNGEFDPLLLPEVISTEGCVALKNLNNILELPYITIKELKKIIPEFNEYFKGDKNGNFHYSLGVQSNENPLQYLISDLLENILLKIGHQQLGRTNIQYNLLEYHIPMENKNKWIGTAINIGNYTDPRLSYIDNLNYDLLKN